jgi:CDP-diacylglycerol--glycerol-3-phosphate 3-phosphatidyltransferase
MTPVGRHLDPLTDKVLICGAFIYLMAAPQTGVDPWMVTLVVAREVVITGVRGIVEATGAAFGADRFGKLKTVLQCAAIIAVLAALWARQVGVPSEVVAAAEVARTALLYTALAATVGSGVQYLVKATRVLKNQH